MPDRADEVPTETWAAFANRHADSPFLGEDPLYALTAPVIDAICKVLPKFFTKEEERLERDLAGMTEAGFFLKRGLGRPTISFDEPDSTIGEFLDLFLVHEIEASKRVKRPAPTLKPGTEDSERFAASYRDLIGMLWKDGGRPQAEIQKALRQGRHEEEVISRRSEAYAGWLILNEEFRRELGVLKTRWEPEIARRGGFARPAVIAAGGDPEEQSAVDPCAKECFAFYRRWCLERMLTWELPAPLDAHLDSQVANGPTMTAEEGVTLFLPWSLLKGNQLDLQDVLWRIRFESTPEHLRGWVCKGVGREDGNTGELTYQRLYHLYRTFELVLSRRYGSACARNIEKLDRALGKVMHCTEDWVKRLRQRLTREHVSR